MRQKQRLTLSAFVFDAFVMDGTKLAVALAGCTTFSGKRTASGNRAYRIVAQDVLGYMCEQGHLTMDRWGWYHLVPSKLEIAPCPRPIEAPAPPQHRPAPIGGENENEPSKKTK
jgi:hypothetical protein